MKKIKNNPRHTMSVIGKKSVSGITLIALVVTIVVLLILAGVSISMLGGENGIIKQAVEAKDKNKIEAIKERINLWKTNKQINELTVGNNTSSLIDELYKDGLITEAEKTKLENGESIIIGKGESWEEEISLVPTIGDIYSEEMIGQVIKNDTLDANLPEGTEWIILGKDEDGSIMLTTSKPIENGFTANGTAQAWLTYETDLNTACAVYGGTVQGKTITSRSMTLKDVNRVTGFVEPSFNTYTFTNEATNDYANKRVNYWHPDTNGTATSSDGTGDPNYWSKNATTYECDAYYYFIDTSDNNTVKYSYEGTSWGEANYTRSTLKNTNIILGDSLDYVYLLASRSVNVDSGNANFDVAFVCEGLVHSNYNDLCLSDSDSFNDLGNSDAVPVRPIINLPSNIQVEEVSGEWSIID